jgi:hypothetical protein
MRTAGWRRPTEKAEEKLNILAPEGDCSRLAGGPGGEVAADLEGIAFALGERYAFATVGRFHVSPPVGERPSANDTDAYWRHANIRSVTMLHC